MAILNSCCCCKSIRKACYACAIYSLVIYLFLITVVTEHFVAHPEAATMEKSVKHESVLMPDPFVGGSWVIYLYETALVLSVIGSVTSILLIIGIWKDKKLLLLPWLIDAPLIILVDLIYVAILGYEKRMSPTPTVAMALTADFFLFILNCYAVLCVISQFQEYNAGRGRAVDERPEAGFAAQFSKTAPPTINSCEVGRRTVPVYEAKSQVNGNSPRQSRRSFRNPSIKVSRIDKNIKDDLQTGRQDSAPYESNAKSNMADGNCENFTISECIRSPDTSTTSSTTDGSLIRKVSKKKPAQFPKLSEKDSSKAEPAPDISETSGTTECESSSGGRDWVTDKALEESPLILLAEVVSKE